MAAKPLTEDDFLDVELLMEELQQIALSKIVHAKRLQEFNKPIHAVSPPAISENNESSFVMTPYYSVHSETNEKVGALFSNYNNYILKLVKDYVNNADQDTEV